MLASAIDVPRAQDARETAAEVVGLLHPALHDGARSVLAGLQIRLELSSATELIVARIESACPELVLIDTDLVGCPDELCRFARSLRSDVKVLGLSYYWSDREEALRSCVDAILHKPARDAEWCPALRRFGIRDVTNREAPVP